MPKFYVQHGSLSKGGKSHGVGEAVELTEAEAKACDPRGEYLATAERWEKVQAKAKIEAQLAKDDEPKPEPKSDGKK